MVERFAKLRCIATFLTLTIFCCNPLWADDTEIFFSPVSKVDAQPNIILLLDASYSMLFYDCADGSRKWTPCADGSENGNVTRLDRMNAAMVDIVNNTSDVNIGVMRFSNTYGGSKVIYPVRNIELELCDGVPCDDDTETEFSGTRTTVRQEIIDVIQQMVMQWRTPTVGGLLEASKYFEGKPVHYGKTRWSPSDAHWREEEGENSRVSHPDSYTGGELIRSGECSDADLSHEDCADERIDGNPIYTSPITNECQSNHLLLVTDGASNQDNPAITLSKALVGNNCPAYDNSGQCAVEIADYLYETDLRPDIDGVQNVTTHTVGFNLESDWLRDIATGTRVVDGTEVPGYYVAESKDELTAAITTIFNSINTENTTFVAPGATVDRFSRITHRNDLYLSLFNPSESAAWEGNLKRYDLKGNPAALYDSSEPPMAVVDESTGHFRVDSKSYWSEQSDGHDVAVGGAASRLNHLTRKAVTYAGTTQKNLFHEDNVLSIDNELLTYNADSVISNVAPTGTATQSSVGYSGSPGRAIDGNTSGRYRDKSVTHTKNEAQPWWQLALPETTNVDHITLYNRTDCCTHRLTDVHVFVSQTPFGGETIDELKANPAIWHQFLPGEQSPNATVNVNTKGRYVRVQLAGSSNPLSLAEVEIYGGDSAAELADKQNILDWARGRDVKDEDGDDDTQESRLHMGDPLHSNPITVTYGGDASDPDSVVYVGTNEGYLHAINTRDGSEQFAFMPQELIGNLKRLYYGESTDKKVYGMDGGLTLWADDKNLDGTIDSAAGEHAYLYAGLRRGGSNYYALDVSDRNAPEFKWQINGGSSGFKELGETWSRMVPATIRYGTTTKKVLIFGGGYDNSQDDKTTREPDSIGRALYIVDANTGELIWSGGAGDHDETETFKEMIYSMPATPKPIDGNGDGAIEQIYIGDMGGRIWRFDIDTLSSDLDISGGIIADLGTDGVLADARRFYHTPDISRTQSDGKTMVSIAIGSGYQAHPLNRSIEDRFYAIQYPYDFNGHYGMKHENKDESGRSITSYSPIKEDDLYNATENLIGEGDSEEKSIATQQLANAEGWFIKMEDSGEKILGSSVTLDYTVMFTSYSPGENHNNCAPIIGGGKFWAVSLLDGTPVNDFDDPDEEDTYLTKENRNKPLPGQGLPPPPKTLILHTKNIDSDEATDNVQIVTFSGANRAMEHKGLTLTQRVHWSEYPNF